MAQYTIYLLKPDIADFASAIDESKTVTIIDLLPDFPVVGRLILGEQKEEIPGWILAINPHLTQPVVGSLANISAVLLLSVDDRIFAITFGYGRSLLAAGSWVRGFGLKVTLNRVSHDKLRSIDSKTFQDVVVSTRRQTSKDTDITPFELDTSRALLRGVTGNPLDFEKVTKLTGSDSLLITCEYQLQSIHELLSELLVAFGEAQYLEHFSWYDNVRPVDDSVAEELDTLLVEMLNGELMDVSAYLAPVGQVEWADVVEFSFTYSGNVRNPELRLNSYLAVIRNRGQFVSLKSLRNHKVFFHMNDGTEDPFSVYDCLVWETSVGDNQYALFDGQWFRINQDYVAALDDFINGLVDDHLNLPDAGVLDEGPYNAKVAEDLPARFALMDRRTVAPTQGTTQIEFCDLLDSEHRLIHVKKREDSAALSHLFAQGYVSAELFMFDQGFRLRVREKLTEFGLDAFLNTVPDAQPIPANYEIVYAIIAPPVYGVWPPRLFFFSKVNLRRHAEALQRMGFRVSVQYIRK